MKDDLSISVYVVDNNDNKVIYSLLVDLLLYKCGSIQHYATISNFSRLVSNQFNNRNGVTHFCKCIYGFTTAELLEDHVTNCRDPQRTQFPQDSRCRFTNVQKQLPASFVAHADFESILQPLGEAGVDVTQGVGVGVLPQLLFKSTFHAVLPSR